MGRITFRVQVHGVYAEDWEVDAYDVHDAVTRIKASEGQWLDAGFVAEPRYTVKPLKVIEKEAAATAEAAARVAARANASRPAQGSG